MNDFLMGLLLGAAMIFSMIMMWYELTPVYVIRECEKDLPRSSQCKLIAVEDKEVMNNAS